MTGWREISPHYLRLSFDDGGMLGEHAVHPTMWIRMWFSDGDKSHQRGYTLVDPDPAAGAFDVEFALHEGIASDWARNAQPGDTIDATVLGSKFAIPDPPPGGYVIVGDTASLPAINSLLESIGEAPARVFLEAGYDEDKSLPVARTDDVTWVDRKDDGNALLETVRGRHSTRAITSAGLPAAPAPPARSPRHCVRTSAFRANLLRHKPIGWPDRRSGSGRPRPANRTVTAGIWGVPLDA
ncbi:siderophore-interacting FAD-binding domain protein [Mycobacterium kansasii]|uniref:Siderophore-interacting FAD-binding domain protein n=1 Tax=Mycobacterium kansasii TaxID=1768 RepID=A0A1V3XJD8_MYCKA|nr:siderophore-interacting FAD-binding domain protein [Mycobacterium kansasii]